jgi:hypothetical protein
MRCCGLRKSHSFFAAVIHCRRSGIIVCVRFVHRAIGVGAGVFGFLVLSGGRRLTLRGGRSEAENCCDE